MVVLLSLYSMFYSEFRIVELFFSRSTNVKSKLFQSHQIPKNRYFLEWLVQCSVYKYTLSKKYCISCNTGQYYFIFILIINKNIKTELLGL